ncbi:lysM and putative peptidoglycan-binding domain-containing protein 3 [Copidosoma floridanum]|uniref:lysM and putative peptidoglycan-binding domain-containing protein 3 n=1 Tax=Copidosoma floridanum TaxID=29053 RepID=UPI0006C9C6DC|nr:lysM and putative peptidoglycan-binding domain-containing protein 3 [Copidosoma floridanum]
MRKKSTSSSTEQHKSGRQIAYQRGNQTESSSPHYVFLYSEDDQSEDEEQLLSLKVRHPQLRKVEVINVQIQSDDTLQALALRYRCSISELKRINNIHKENEIHAHRSIKVPVKAYSLLTETVGQNNEILMDNDQPTVFKQPGLTILGDNQSTSLIGSSSAVEINNIILNSLVEPLNQLENESSQCLQEAEEETDQLIATGFSPKNNKNFVNTFKCSGADWGLSWFQLVCFSLLLGFAGPIIYVLYIAESSKHHNSFRL